LLANDAVSHLFAANEDSAPGRRPLEAWGAGFEHEYYNDEFLYTHTWLAEALRLDSTSHAANLAFVSLIGGCDPGPVIERGERYMVKIADPALRAQLHFALGDAYADSVGLAGQVDVGSSYRHNVQDAPAARAKAIEHYRSGLAIDHSSRFARAAWSKAWRLLAGVPPLVLVFHCEAD